MKIFKAMMITCLAVSGWTQTAEEILDKAAEALGGKAATEAVSTTITTGTITIPGGFSGTIETFTKDGGKILVKMNVDLPGMKMTMLQGCDGTDCYSNDPNFGLRLLEGQEKETMLLQNDFLSQIDWRKMYKKVEYKGEGSINGRKTYKVYTESEAGMKMTSDYDAESYLVLHSDGSSQSAMGMMNITIDYKDYKDVHEHLKVPMTMEMGTMGQVMVYTLEKVEVNVDIPDSRFKLPEGLK